MRTSKHHTFGTVPKCTKKIKTAKNRGEIVTLYIKLRNISWKLEYVLSFNMGWRILVFYLEQETISHTIYAAKFEQTIIHQHLDLRRESQSHAQAHVLMRSINRSCVSTAKEGRHVRMINTT